MESIRISYFSDVLCGWAYVAQMRLHELKKTFQDKIAIVILIELSVLAIGLFLDRGDDRSNHRCLNSYRQTSLSIVQ